MEKVKDSRIQWVDALKGFLIILVVIGHTCARLEGSSALFSFITTFHMPLFFMVSGYLALNVTKKKTADYIKRKILTLLLPFFSFAIISSFIRGWDNFPAFFLTSTKHGYWFLLALFVFCVLFIFCCKIAFKIPFPKKMWATQNKEKIEKCIMGGTFLFFEMVFILIYLISSPIIKELLFPKTLFLYWPYYVLGYVLAHAKVCVNEYIVGFCGLAFFVLWWSTVKYGMIYETLFQISRLCACVFFFYGFMNFASNWLMNGLSVIGKETLSIYVMHYWFYPGMGAYILSHMGGFMLFEVFAFILVAVLISVACIAIKRVVCSNQLLALLLFGQLKKNIRQ